MIFIYLITVLIAPQLWLEPFVGIRVDLFIYPLWLVLVLIRGRGADLVKFQEIDFLIMGFIGWIFLSALVNDKNEHTWTLIADYVKWFVMYRLVVASIDEAQSVKKVTIHLTFLVYVIVVEGIQHKLSPDGIGWAGQSLGWVDQSVLDAGGTGRTKWVNNFDGPGVFCVMYTLALPFVLQYLDKHFSFFKKLFAVAAIAPLLLAIWYTGSRGGFLATIAIFGGYLLFRNAERLKLSLWKLSLIAVLGLAVLMAAPKHMTQIRDDNNSAQHRVDMWIQGLEMVEQNPLFGIGRGNYVDYTGSLIAHNSAIENMGELGMPGLFFWVAMFYMCFRYLFAYAGHASEPSQASLARALILCLVGYLVSSLFVTLEYETYYFIFALVAVLAKLLPEKPGFGLKDCFIVGSLCIGWYGALKIFTSVYY